MCLQPLPAHLLTSTSATDTTTNTIAGQTDIPSSTASKIRKKRSVVGISEEEKTLFDELVRSNTDMLTTKW